MCFAHGHSCVWRIRFEHWELITGSFKGLKLRQSFMSLFIVSVLALGRNLVSMHFKLWKLSNKSSKNSTMHCELVELLILLFCWNIENVVKSVCGFYKYWTDFKSINKSLWAVTDIKNYLSLELPSHRNTKKKCFWTRMVSNWHPTILHE